MSDDTITVLYFAWVREVTGVDEERIAYPAAGLTGSDLVEILCERYPALAPRAARLHLAVNQDHMPLSTALKPTDEIALFPPVTGG